MNILKYLSKSNLLKYLSKTSCSLQGQSAQFSSHEGELQLAVPALRDAGQCMALNTRSPDYGHSQPVSLRFSEDNNICKNCDKLGLSHLSILLVSSLNGAS